eukprot:1159159-Pelagomonas_calceolata.AAC.2
MRVRARLVVSMASTWWKKQANNCVDYPFGCLHLCVKRQQGHLKMTTCLPASSLFPVAWYKRSCLSLLFVTSRGMDTGHGARAGAAAPRAAPAAESSGAKAVLSSKRLFAIVAGDGLLDDCLGQAHFG